MALANCLSVFHSFYLSSFLLSSLVLTLPLFLSHSIPSASSRFLSVCPVSKLSLYFSFPLLYFIPHPIPRSHSSSLLLSPSHTATLPLPRSHSSSLLFPPSHTATLPVLLSPPPPRSHSSSLLLSPFSHCHSSSLLLNPSLPQVRSASVHKQGQGVPVHHLSHYFRDIRHVEPRAYGDGNGPGI